MAQKLSGEGENSMDVMSLKELKHTQETLYVLQNKPLMQQITASLHTYQAEAGRIADKIILDEVLGISSQGSACPSRNSFTLRSHYEN